MAKRMGLLKGLAVGGAFLAAMFLLSARVNAQGGGEKVYKAKCATCHGPEGAGTTPAGKATKARDFCSDEVKKENDEEWTAIIGKGKNKMPAYDKKLTDAEIKDVVAYIRGLCKK
jgi:cytochrome c6